MPLKLLQILKTILVACIVLAGTKPAGAQYVEVRASLDTNQILIGDQFNMFISISQPKDMTVIYPQYKDSVIDKIEVLKQFPPDTVPAGNNQIKISQRYLLTSFDSGMYVIPPITFRMLSGPWSDSIRSNPVYLAVYSIPLDSAGRIFDIKAPLGSPLQFSEFWPYIVAFLVVAGLAIFLIQYLRRRKGKKPLLGFTRPEDPPYVIALRELDRLAEEKLWQHGHIKQYYTRLTEIIRSYLEKQFEIPSMEMTSEETLELWKKSGNKDNELYANLKDLLGLADLVKFAKEKPLPSFNEMNLTRAYDFVRKTRPVITLVSEQEAAGDASAEVPVSDNQAVITEKVTAPVSEANKGLL